MTVANLEACNELARDFLETYDESVTGSSDLWLGQAIATIRALCDAIELVTP